MKNLIALLVGKKKPSDSSQGDSEAPPSSQDLSSDYGNELADILNVKEEDKDAFTEALKGFVRQCHDDNNESAGDEE